MGTTKHSRSGLEPVWNCNLSKITQVCTLLDIYIYNLDTHKGRQVAGDCDNQEKVQLSVSCIKINSSQSVLCLPIM